MKKPTKTIIVGKMTDQEYDAVTKELWKRFLDLTYESRKELLPRDILEKLDKDDTFTMKRMVTFIGNDVRQILGRLRRRKWWEV